jgi:hemolysin activation/secretion protein
MDIIHRSAQFSIFYFLIPLFISFSIVSDAFAQTSLPPSPEDEAARQLIRQQQRNQLEQQRQQQQINKDVRLSEAAPLHSADDAIPDNESPCFLIQTIELEGDHAASFQWLLHHTQAPNQALSQAAVNQASASRFSERPVSEHSDELLGEDLSLNEHPIVETLWQPRCIGTTGINIIMARIQNALVEQGYITSRIVIADQDLSRGTLSLTVVPGRIREIQLSQPFNRHILPIDRDTLLNLRDIEQSLESMKRLPSVEADIQIVPAQGENVKPGESDLDIQWQQGRPWRLVTTLDNSGTDNTGLYQGGVSLAYDNLFGLHDILNVTYSHDVGGADPLKGGTEAFSLNYSVPVGYWTVALNANANEYVQTVQGAFEQIKYRGDSRTASLDIARLLHRDSRRKITTGVNVWFRHSKNFTDDLEQVNQRRRTGGWEWRWDLRQFIGTATLDGSISYRKGTGIFDAQPAPEERFGEGTSRPSIIKSNLQLSLPFTVGEQRWQYVGSWRRQHNRDPLIPQDRFSIGGRYTVRGFDGERTLSAERGWLIRNDVSLYLGQSNHALYLGIDYGQVNGFSEQFLVGDHLAGGVLGVKGKVWGIDYDLALAAPINRPEGFSTDRVSTYFSIQGSW